MTNTESMFIRNEKLLHKLSWQSSRRSGIEEDELFSVASLALVECAHEYDPTKGTESTFIWNRISNALYDFCKKESKQNHGELCEGESIPFQGHTNIENVIELKQSIALLSPAAYDAVWFVANRPDVIGLDGTETNTQARQKVKRYIRAQGHSLPLVQQTMQELKVNIGGVPLQSSYKQSLSAH